MGVITFNGKTSSGIFEVSTPPEYEIAERIYDRVTIPGRNGDLLIDTGSYANIERNYEISYGEESGVYHSLSAKVSDFLNSGIGYLRLEDTYEPNYFFLASYKGPNNLANILAQAGKATITFDRKPERFLKTGENVVNITGSYTLTNPTIHPAKPFIKVLGTGAGWIKVNNYQIDFTTISSYVYVDCDIEDVYKDNLNQNQNAKAPSGFPILKSGANSISFGGSISKLEIKPRWWTL